MRLVATGWFGWREAVFAQKTAIKLLTTPRPRDPADTNSVRWHTITITPKAGRAKIHFDDKLNPVGWLENFDEPVPPAWYLPQDEHRITK